ncbi:GNAT family N-acetyltransferase [Patescibacteria group bacterium]|nr:GNAT family N-acetyltransferase [Patescibacteria group bacterium]MBU1613434.1 GNAT family N-acetyltransferase [Patescibacteria group bacterium]
MEIEKEIKKKNYSIKFSAKKNNEEIGRAYLCLIFNDLHEKPYGLLEDVFVQEKNRRSGLGTRLIQTVINEAKVLGCHKLIATSRHEREKIHRWYEKMGFKNHGIEFRIDL